jgi:hypothetical protein
VSDIFREIEEELRRDNFLKLWQRFGKYIIALVVVAIVAVVLVVGWRQYRSRARQAEGVRYAAALDLLVQGKSQAAAAALAAMSGSVSGGRAMMVKLEEASIKAKANDYAGATALYRQIATDDATAPIYRDLATVLSADLTVDRNPKAVVAQLKPLTDASNPWHYTALELTAVAELGEGDQAAARKIYRQLADDLKAPGGLRARAAEMTAALGP